MDLKPTQVARDHVGSRRTRRRALMPPKKTEGQLAKEKEAAEASIIKACRNDTHKIIAAAVAKGADPNCKNAKGVGHRTRVEHLPATAGDSSLTPSSRTHAGNSAMHVAAGFGAMSSRKARHNARDRSLAVDALAAAAVWPLGALRLREGLGRQRAAARGAHALTETRCLGGNVHYRQVGEIR